MVGTYHVASEIPDDSDDGFFTTGDEMVGRVVEEDINQSQRSLFEVVHVTDDKVLLRELLTGQEITKEMDKHNTVLLGRPSIGQEHTVWWIDVLDGTWKPWESEEGFNHFYHRTQAVNAARSIDGETRVRSETYYHRLDEFEAWDIRIEDGDPYLIPEALEVNGTLNQIFRQISDDVPDKAHVGTVYTDTVPVEHDADKDHEIVWFEIEYPFRRDNYRTPVELLERDQYE